jgi:hypothetical protein
VEANSTGGQGSRRAVAPSDDDDDDDDELEAGGKCTVTKLIKGAQIPDVRSRGTSRLPLDECS